MRLLNALLLAALLSGCGADREVTVRFDALVGDAPARCGDTYDGVGTTGTTLTMGDLRFYVHDVRFLTADGGEVPMTLDEASDFQDGAVALLDFEDKSDTFCSMGTEATNTALVGTVPDGVEIIGVRFTLGVPRDRNHEDVTFAPAPLNQGSMYWGWNGGYKFFRLDGATTGLAEGFFVHLGDTACEGDGRGNITGCAQDNRAEITLMGFDPDTQSVAVDVGALLSENDMDANGGGPPGCMSGFDDPDCATMFGGFGLPVDGAPGGAQRLFRVR